MVPGFRAVPATSHLFDLAGGYVQYPDLEQEAAQYQTRSAFGILSGIGSLFGRGSK
jgi:hypothetical protein